MSIDVLRTRLERWLGLSLERGRRHDVLDTLVRERTRALKLKSTDEYCAQIDRPEHEEVQRIVNAVTVTYTWFYRNPPQFEALSELFKNTWSTREHVRVWVPACATGEDPYTVAMIAANAGRTVSVLGTDINTAALEHARAGVYGPWSVRDLPSALQRFTTKTHSGAYEISPAVRRTVTLQRHNLIDAPPTLDGQAGFDLIICRNVLIYFPREVAQETLVRISGAVSRDGWVMLGGSEVLVEIPPGFVNVPFGGHHALHRGARTETPAPRASRPSQPRPPAQVPRASAPRALPPPSAPRASASAPKPSQPPRRSAPPPAPARAPAPRPAPPKTNAALVASGSAHLRDGRVIDAIRDLERALELDPLNAVAQMLLGIALYRVTDLEAAERSLQGALVLDPELWPAAFYMALAASDLGRTDDARRGYQWVVDMLSRPTATLVDPALADFEPWKDELLVLAKMRCDPRARA